MSYPYGNGPQKPEQAGSAEQHGTEQYGADQYGADQYGAEQYLDPYTGAPISPPYPQQPYPAQPYGGQPYGGQPYPPPYGAQPYGGAAYLGTPTKTNGLAIGALVTAVAGLFLCGIGSLVGAILGHVALGQIRRTGEQGHGIALAAVIVGWALTALGALYWVFVVVVAVQGSS